MGVDICFIMFGFYKRELRQLIYFYFYFVDEKVEVQRMLLGYELFFLKLYVEYFDGGFESWGGFKLEKVGQEVNRVK